MIEHRALLPNGNDPDSVPPGTVGPPDARAGDPDGFAFITTDPWPAPPSIPPPAAWSGWPAGWATSWSMGAGRLDELADIAWTCMDLNSQVLSTMPPYLIGAAESLPTSWIDNPDPDAYTSWEEFASQLFFDFQAGEVFVLATARYSNGWPARFHVVEPWLVNVDIGRDGHRHYTIGGINVDDDMLHIRYRSRRSAARGQGPLEVGQLRLIAARVLVGYGTQFAASGGVPTSVLTHPGEITAAQADELRSQWVTARMAQMGLPAVLSGGVQWTATQANPKDMALTDLLQVNETRIAVMLGVPPHLVALPSGGDPMTYSNVSQQYDAHWRAFLRPRAQAVMSAMSQWLLPRGVRIEVNRDAYVQPGPLERAQTAAIWHGIEADGQRVLSVEEIRLQERFDTPTTTIRPGVLT